MSSKPMKRLWVAEGALCDPAFKGGPILEVYLAADVERVVEEKVDNEVARWQERIRDLCCRVLPDVDGAGCDTGDPLDLTATEISQCFNHLRDALAAKEAELYLVAHFVSMKHPNETPMERQLRYENFLHHFANPEWRAAMVRAMNTPGQEGV